MSSYAVTKHSTHFQTKILQIRDQRGMEVLFQQFIVGLVKNSNQIEISCLGGQYLESNWRSLSGGPDFNLS